MLLVAVIALTVLVAVWVRRPRRPPLFPPGPPTFLIFGNLWQTLDMFNGHFHALAKTSRQLYGDIVGYVLPNGLKTVHLFSFDVIKEVGRRADFSGRPETFGLLVRCYDQKLGIVLNDGPNLFEHRRFAQRHLRELGLGSSSAEATMLEEIDLLTDEMARDRGAPMPVKLRFTVTMLNFLWRMVAGRRLDAGAPETAAFVRSVNELIELVGPRAPMNHMAWLRHLLPEWSGYAAMLRHRRLVGGMFARLIDEHRRDLDARRPRDFVDRFLVAMRAPDAAARLYTERNLTVIGMDFLVAGMLAMSTTMSWALLLMVMHPRVQERVHAEIGAVLGGARVAFADRARLPFTRATLMEVARLASVTPQGVSHCTTGDTWLRGFVVPKGTVVVVHLEEVHMDAAYWGDPEAFRPDRFLAADGTVRREERLIPFGIGMRLCLGDKLASMQLFMAFTCLVQRFRFAAAPGQKLSLDKRHYILNEPMQFYVDYELRDQLDSSST